VAMRENPKQAVWIWSAAACRRCVLERCVLGCVWSAAALPPLSSWKTHPRSCRGAESKREQAPALQRVLALRFSFTLYIRSARPVVHLNLQRNPPRPFPTPHLTLPQLFPIPPILSQEITSAKSTKCA